MKDGDTVRVYETERALPCHFKMEVQIAADVPQMSEEQRDKVAAQLQAALDRLILKAIYGGE